MMTVDDCMRAAWQALLKGDLAERDRWRTPIEPATDAQAELAARVANDIRRWNRGSDRLEPGETYVVTEMDFERRPDGSYGLRGC